MTFRIVTRGAPRPIRCDFRCPEHGTFTALALTEANDYAMCPTCDSYSPWTPSVVPMRMKRVEARKGGIERPEHPEWDFTRNLEEGQDPDEWEAEREKAAEDRRKQIVVDAVRSER